MGNGGWTNDTITTLIVPSNGGPGTGVPYISIDGTTGQISFYDASNNLVGQLDPNSATVGFEFSAYPTGGSAAWVPATYFAEIISPGRAALQIHPPVPVGGNQFGQIAIVGGDGVSASTSRIIIESGVNAGEIDLQSATVISPAIFWDTVGNSTPETWHNVTPQNLFTLGTPPLQYRMLASPPNTVQLTGEVVSGATVASGTTIATLPAGYFSATKSPLVQALNVSSAANLFLVLSTSGQLQLHGTWANTNTILINALFSLDIN